MADYSLFTSESVAAGHPDKIADQISDGILDEIIAQDKLARVACETLVNTGMVLVAGEITTSSWVDIEKLARKIIKEIGYTDPTIGFDGDSCAVLTAIGKQSPDIALGVDATSTKKLGAGDQGLMFGYATSETPEFMPIPIVYAHRLMQRQGELIKNKTFSWLRPDGKSQVTLRYDHNRPTHIDNIVVSVQHNEEITHDTLVEAVMDEIIKPVIPEKLLDQNTKFFINPTGRFVVGGPTSDTGLTGRKIIVDTYGGMARHGGGCFSGKDPTKVDRSAAYAARYVAKNIVAAKLAERCEIQLSYAIGIAEPTSISINTFDTGKVDNKKLLAIIKNNFDLTPSGIISSLNLLQPIYLKTAAYGHFGRNEEGFTWEKTDKVEQLKDAVY